MEKKGNGNFWKKLENWVGRKKKKKFEGNRKGRKEMEGKKINMEREEWKYKTWHGKRRNKLF